MPPVRPPAPVTNTRVAVFGSSAPDMITPLPTLVLEVRWVLALLTGLAVAWLKGDWGNGMRCTREREGSSGHRATKRTWSAALDRPGQLVWQYV